MFISQKIGLKKFNLFNISQITYGLSKANKGTSEFWKEIGELYVDKSNQIDKLGIAILINSFGRSQEATL